MRKIFLIIFLVFLFFLTEFILFNLLGKWFVPNLLLLLIMFLGLYFGIRHSLFASILGGMLKDSFTIGFFGINIFSFIVCAFTTTFLKKYIYHTGFRSARLILISIIITVNLLIRLIINAMFAEVRIVEILQHILLPEFISTVIVSSLVFEGLKKCASKLSV